MQLSYEPAKGEDAPAIFAFAWELIERYETDPDLDLSMALDWTRRKIEKRIGEYTRVLADGTVAAYYRLAPDGERLELDDLYVLPAFRDRGVGTSILRRCLALGKDPDKTAVRDCMTRSVVTVSPYSPFSTFIAIFFRSPVASR